jgi:mono/diheme cytochrome c family protein
MNSPGLTGTPRRFGFAMPGLLGLGLLWWLGPGLAVLRAPRADGEETRAGLALFEHQWQPGDPLAHGDGLGPVFNASSCVSCHFQGGSGGGGGSHLVLAFEVHPTPDHPDVRGGMIHEQATEDRFRESGRSLRDLFPIVPGGLHVQGICYSERRDFDPVRTERLNPTALFGVGGIDRISGRSIRNQGLRGLVAACGREFAGEDHVIPPGRPRVLPDGRVGKFGWKAQFATLEEFVASACANELGLGTPGLEQAKPLGGQPRAEAEPDLDAKQFRSLVAFVGSLPRPTEIEPTDPQGRGQVGRGKALFQGIGCAACHTPDLGGVTGVYSDLLLHRLDDRRGGGGYGERPDVPLPADHPLPQEWKTPPLWGVADSAPYFHDGGSPSLEAAIERHRGDAEDVTESYQHLSEGDRAAVIAFLKSLRAPAAARPL